MSLKSDVAEIVKQLESLDAQWDDVRAGECVKRCHATLPRLHNGRALLEQVEKLVRAQNADRAARLLRAVPIKSRVRVLVSSVIMIPLIGAGVIGAGYFMPASCGGTEAIEAVEGCPAAVYALGTPVAQSPVGLSCGEAETSGNQGWSSWHFPVKGREASGTLYYEAEMNNGVWEVYQARLEIDGRTISVVPCETPTAPK